MITLRCRCGELYHTDEANVGRKIQCRGCGRTHVIRLPKRPAAAPASARSPGFRRAGAQFRSKRPAGLRRWSFSLAAAYLGGTLLAALLLRGLGDAWWPATFLLFSGRWVLLLPLALLVPLAVLAWDVRSIALLATGALVVLFPIMGLQAHLAPSESDAFATPGHLRIVTLNTGDSRRVAYDLAVRLEGWNADVVLLQECRSHVADAVRATSGWQWHVDGGSLCLLSRHPIESAESMDRTDLDGVRQASRIGGAGFVTRYTLRLPSGPLRITNLHLETARKGFEGVMRGSTRELVGNTQLRAIEARLASRWAAAAGPADIVAGDFNTPPESRIYRSAWGAMTNAFSEVGSGFGYTRHNGWVRVRIDHVLVGDRWRPLRAVLGDDVGSDHRPLIVDVAPAGR